jgi:hypothetical protein
MSRSHVEKRLANDLQEVADVLCDQRPGLDPLALDAVKLRAISRARRSTSSRQKGFFMRSRLTTVLTVAFLSLGTGGALAVAGGLDFGLAGNNGRSASFSQYREVPPVQVPSPRASNPPATSPPASKFQPRPATASVSKHGVATVRCPTACHIVLSVRRGSHRVRVKVTLHASGSAKIRLTKDQLKHLGRGRAVFSVEVNGKQVTQGTLKVA